MSKLFFFLIWLKIQTGIDRQKQQQIIDYLQSIDCDSYFFMPNKQNCVKIRYKMLWLTVFFNKKQSQNHRVKKLFNTPT